MSEYIIAVIMGIVEGLTEFLPVSSTGHLILTGHLLGFTGDKAEAFEVVIQLGAILAVVLLYFKRFIHFLDFKFLFGHVAGQFSKKGYRKAGRLTLLELFVASVPAGILGLLFHKSIKEFLFNPATVAVGLIAGGIFVIVVEKMKFKEKLIESIDGVSLFKVFQIGLIQCLAMWPGFSRSGATIAGGMFLGLSRKCAAELSFFLAVPILFAASAFDFIKMFPSLTAEDFRTYAIGFFVSFVVAYVVIIFFIRIVSKVSLVPFAIYRFILAAVILGFMYLK